MTQPCLTDRQWSLIAPLCLGKPGDPGRTGSDNRVFVEGLLWVARTNSPWRKLPPGFGKWNTAFCRYRDWLKTGAVARIFEVLSADPDMQYTMVWLAGQLGPPARRMQPIAPADWHHVA